MTSKISPPSGQGDSIYWRRTRRLTALLMAVWLVATVGVIFFARELSTVVFFGWPLSFYMAAQGAVLLYALLNGVYAWRMRHLDQQAMDILNGK